MWKCNAVEPFTSNDTYACPDCMSEVRVGARSCPECGPFRPMEAGPTSLIDPIGPFHSSTSYSDARRVLEESPISRPPWPRPSRQATFQSVRVVIWVLIGLTLLSIAISTLQNALEP